MGAQMTGTKVD
jgi:hypothetical protein